MSNPIDLSKYAKGRRLKCVDASAITGLTLGRVYEATTDGGRNFVSLTNDNGNSVTLVTDRFVPVEDEAPVCLCGPMHDNGRNRSCPDHGVRCNRADCDKLCDGVDAWQHYNGQRRDYCSKVCHDLAHPEFAKPVPPVAASPKPEKPPLGSPPYDNPRLFTPDRQVRVWDRDRYNGLGASTYQQLSSLDKRIAVARAELDLGTAERMKRMAGQRHPHEGHSDRVTGYRRWGQL